MVWNTKYKAIIYTAIYTTPFIGLFGITPIIMPIVMSHFDKGEFMHHDHPMQISLHHQNNFIPFLIVTIQVAFIWLQNILLLVYGSTIFARFRFGAALRFLCSYFFCATIVIALHHLIFHPVYPHRYNNDFRYLMPIISAFATNTIELIIIELLLIRHSETQVRIENAELKMQHMQAQHEKLLHQLNPHFLFNSLNALKTLMKRRTNEAETYLVKLSEFLRFSLAHNEHTVVPLEEELKFSLTYLEMQKTRFADSLIYEVNIPDIIRSGKKLPVFSLQILLENCLKHNTFTKEYPLKITIDYKDQCIAVSNNLQKRNHIENSSGVGLANLSQRYKYLGGEVINIVETDDCFTVCLKLL